MEWVKITDSFYREEFINHIKDIAKLGEDEDNIAKTEYETFLESMGSDHEGDPYDDAEECLSYWVE